MRPAALCLAESSLQMVSIPKRHYSPYCFGSSMVDHGHCRHCHSSRSTAIVYRSSRSHHHHLAPISPPAMPSIHARTGQLPRPCGCSHIGTPAVDRQRCCFWPGWHPADGGRLGYAM
jgi:hypothetical protein